MRILITGIAGMIGSHLLDRLLEKDLDVIGVDNLSYGKIDNIQHHLQNDRFVFHKSDILDPDTLLNLGKGVDTIVHLASVKKVGESDSCMATLEVNGQGAHNVLEAAKHYGSKVVLASTSDVYGMSPNIPFCEDDDLFLGPSHVKRWGYAVAKLYSEQMAFAYFQDHQVPVAILRYFGGFSCRSNVIWSGGHIPMFVDAVLNDREIIIHGDGSQTRSMAHVDDLINGTLLAMEAEEVVGEVINLGNDEEMSILDTAIFIHNLAGTGKPLKLKFIEMADVFGDYKDIARRKPDLDKARSILGYTPSVTFEEGLKRVIAACKKGMAVTKDKQTAPDIMSLDAMASGRVVELNRYIA